MKDESVEDNEMISENDSPSKDTSPTDGKDTPKLSKAQKKR